jgi:hypothetical protein
MRSVLKGHRTHISSNALFNSYRLVLHAVYRRGIAPRLQVILHFTSSQLVLRIVY